MNILELLDKVKNGIELKYDELAFIINGYVDGSVADYQMACFLTSVCINGMTNREILDLVKIYIDSGDIVDFNGKFKHIADKHSTGGVGDKTSLIIGPLVASCGVALAKMSGRGLGHTGGTIDKLESIPGFNVDLTEEEFIKVVSDHNIAIIGQTKNIAIADKKIYALRDVTSTVDSIPLIAASIMSKKLASGADNIVIDVKVGRGAILNDYEQSVNLAKTMVDIGIGYGKNINAILSDMNQPLGLTVGNKLEVIESYRFLNGEYVNDLYELCISIATLIVSQCLEIGQDNARSLVISRLNDKSALNVFKEFITAQGGNFDLIEYNYSDVKVKNIVEIHSKKSGYVHDIDALKIANIARDLGAGRFKKDDLIDYNVGIVLNFKINDFVKENDVLAYVYTNDKGLDNLEEKVHESFKITETKNNNIKIIYEVI